MARFEQREEIYKTYFYDRIKAHLQVGTTPHFFQLSRVYWWTLYYLGIEPVGHPDEPTMVDVQGSF